MTVIRHNSISGIVSITAAAGSNLSFYDSTGATLSLDTGDINAGVITATTANFTNATVTGDLTVQGTTTTLDTTVTEVDKLEVGSNNTTVGVAITQSGTGDILRLYDSSTQVVTVADGGNIGIGSQSPRYSLDISGGNLLVSGSAAGNLILEDRSVADGSRPFALLASNDGNFTITNANRNASDQTTSSVERLRITSGGRISINNTSGPTDIPGTAHDTVVVGNPTATGGGITLEVASGNNCGFQMYAQGSQPAARFLYLGSTNTAEIYTQNSGGTSESVRMSFKEDGNVSINNGNLILASGHGIDFSATADGGGTTTSELLDDYERGTWVPTIKFGTTTIASSGYNMSGAGYVKIGHLVYVSATITSIEKGSATGDLYIGNLPFNVESSYSTTGDSTGIMRWQGIGTSDGTILPYFNWGTDYIIPQKYNASSGYYGAVNSTDCDTSISIYFVGGWYYAD